MKKPFLVGLIALAVVILLVVYVPDDSSAGGGPGPGCWNSYSGQPEDIRATAGEVVYMEVYTSSCPATATVDWGSGMIQLFQDDQLGAVSWEYFEVPQDVPGDTAYVVSLDSSDGSFIFHNEARIVVGNPESEPIQLTLTRNGSYWENYEAYLARVLWVDFSLSNVGTNTAYMIWLHQGSITNGVMPAEGISPSVRYDRLAPGEIILVTRNYIVPVGVGGFTSSFSATAEDKTGYNHIFGSAPPAA